MRAKEIAIFALILIAIMCIAKAMADGYGEPDRILTDTEAGYDQAAYDACMDSIDNNQCEDLVNNN